MLAGCGPAAMLSVMAARSTPKTDSPPGADGRRRAPWGPLVILPLVAIIFGLFVWRMVPALGELRAASEMDVVTNNLRLFVSAGHQFLLEHPEVDAVSYPRLVEEDYLDTLEAVAGEDYSLLQINLESALVQVRLEDGRLVAYAF